MGSRHENYLWFARGLKIMCPESRLLGGAAIQILDNVGGIGILPKTARNSFHLAGYLATGFSPPISGVYSKRDSLREDVV